MKSQLKCGEPDKFNRETPAVKKRAAQDYAAMLDLLLQKLCVYMYLIYENVCKQLYVTAMRTLPILANISIYNLAD